MGKFNVHPTLFIMVVTLAYLPLYMSAKTPTGQTTEVRIRFLFFHLPTARKFQRITNNIYL